MWPIFVPLHTIFSNLTSVIGLHTSQHVPPASYSIISKITQLSLFSAKYCHLIQLKYRNLHSGVNKHHILTSKNALSLMFIGQCIIVITVE